MDFSSDPGIFDIYLHNDTPSDATTGPDTTFVNNSRPKFHSAPELGWQKSFVDDPLTSSLHMGLNIPYCEPHWFSEIPMGWTSSSLLFDSQASQFSFETTMNGISSKTSSQSSDDTIGPKPQKRVPKATTMTDEKWKPATARIRHLWVIEKNDYSQIRNTINREFGFDASLRQYKGRVKKLGLQRNCSTRERKAILKHIRYRRERLGKESRHIRVRGHMLSETKISRWWKEPGLVKSLKVVRASSPLPSEISIRTSSRFSSSIDARKATRNEFRCHTNQTITARLLGTFQYANCILEEQETRSIFGDIQKLLESRNDPVEVEWGNAWNPKLELDLIQIRNTMNLQARLTVDPEPALVRNENSNLVVYCPSTNHPRKQAVRIATWHSHYGRMELMFWVPETLSPGRNHGGIHPPPTHARIALYTKSIAGDPVRISLNYDPNDSIPMKLTYQAMVPNDSEVWRIAKAGDVQALRNIFNLGKARLTDRDEEGRSLLSYATMNARVEMCKFLLGSGADPNSMEVNDIGYISPVHHHHLLLACESNDEDSRKRTQCRELMLSFDADPSLEIFNGETWRSSFEDILLFGSCASLKYALLRGEPFITSKTKVVIASGTAQPVLPLMALASICRYETHDILEVLEKAMLFLHRGAEATCVDDQNSNILHSILQAPPDNELTGREFQAKNLMSKICQCQRCNAPFEEPEAFLVAAITAGAKVYAINDHGDTPTMIAEIHGRHSEWTSALEKCGIDVDEVWLHTRAWETVLENLEADYLTHSVEEKASMIQNFNSHFRSEGHNFQQSALTFEQFRKGWNESSRLTINCQYPKPQQNYGYVNQLLSQSLQHGDDRAVTDVPNGNSPRSLGKMSWIPAEEQLITSPKIIGDDYEKLTEDGIPSFINTSIVSDTLQTIEADKTNGSYAVNMEISDFNGASQLESLEVAGAASKISFEEFMDLGMPEACPDEYFQSTLSAYGDLDMHVL